MPRTPAQASREEEVEEEGSVDESPPPADPKKLFVHPNGHQVRFYFHNSLTKDQKADLGPKITSLGGYITSRHLTSDIVLVCEARLTKTLEATAHFYDRNENPEIQRIWVKKLNFVTSCINKGSYEPDEKILKTAMGGRPRGDERKKTAFTHEDRVHLARYIAMAIPNPLSGGRSGNKIYQDLCAQENEPGFEWVQRHPWRSWREHYKMNIQSMDSLIEDCIEVGLGTQVPGKGEYNLIRKPRKARGTRVIQVHDSDSEDEDEEIDELDQEDDDPTQKQKQKEHEEDGEGDGGGEFLPRKRPNEDDEAHFFAKRRKVDVDRGRFKPSAPVSPVDVAAGARARVGARLSNVEVGRAHHAKGKGEERKKRRKRSLSLVEDSDYEGLHRFSNNDDGYQGPMDLDLIDIPPSPALQLQESSPPYLPPPSPTLVNHPGPSRQPRRSAPAVITMSSQATLVPTQTQARPSGRSRAPVVEPSSMPAPALTKPNLEETVTKKTVPSLSSSQMNVAAPAPVQITQPRPRPRPRPKLARKTAPFLDLDEMDVAAPAPKSARKPAAVVPAEAPSRNTRARSKSTDPSSAPTLATKVKQVAAVPLIPVAEADTQEELELNNPESEDFEMDNEVEIPSHLSGAGSTNDDAEVDNLLDEEDPLEDVADANNVPVEPEDDAQVRRTMEASLKDAPLPPQPRSAKPKMKFLGVLAPTRQVVPRQSSSAPPPPPPTTSKPKPRSKMSRHPDYFDLAAVAKQRRPRYAESVVPVTPSSSSFPRKGTRASDVKIARETELKRAPYTPPEGTGAHRAAQRLFSK